MKGWLDSPRVTKLATRRASRGYNQHVQNDLYFWAWVLSGGDKEIVLDAGTQQDGRLESRITLRAAPASFEVRDVADTAEGDDAVMYERSRDEMHAIEEALARLAEAESADAALRQGEEKDVPQN